jgi:hypothetical protein
MAGKIQEKEKIRRIKLEISKGIRCYRCWTILENGKCEFCEKRKVIK